MNSLAAARELIDVAKRIAGRRVNPDKAFAKKDELRTRATAMTERFKKLMYASGDWIYLPSEDAILDQRDTVEGQLWLAEDKLNKLERVIAAMEKLAPR